MKLHLLFVGTKFIYNEPLQEYVLRKAKLHADYIPSIRFYKDGHTGLFLELEKELEEAEVMLVVTTKQHFSTVGKLICTITEDNLVLKEENLLPSKSSIYASNSYIVEYAQTTINVLCMDEMQKMPEILLPEEKNSATIQLFGEDEQSAKALLETLSQTYEVKLEFITLVSEWLEVHIYAKKHGNIAEFIHSAKQLLPNKIIAASNIVTYIIERLAQKGKTITFAESCTGGLMSYFLTRNNGASKILRGSLVTYANEIKTNWLAVDEETLLRHGAVSKEVVEQMSEGALRVSEADYAISVSGIAGDSGGSAEKPVGTVFIGVRSDTWHKEERKLFFGDRNYIQYQSVLEGIKMLLLNETESFF